MPSYRLVFYTVTKIIGVVLSTMVIIPIIVINIFIKITNATVMIPIEIISPTVYDNNHYPITFILSQSQ